jgi:uncharacterized membrane protein
MDTAWDHGAVSRGGPARPGRAGRVVLISVIAALFALVGDLTVGVFLSLNALSQCSTNTPVVSGFSASYESCSASVPFFPWVALGLIGGAGFGAVFAVGFIHVVRFMRRTAEPQVA